MIAGITGHQKLGTSRAWVRQTLAEQIAHYGITRGISSLAIGADQLFAQLLREAGIPYEILLPCAKYEQTFAEEHQKTFYQLVATAAVVKQLQYAEPSEQSFLAAGQRVVDECELLFAVWNGLPARGLGGTGDIVAFARLRNRSWIHIDPTRRITALGT